MTEAGPVVETRIASDGYPVHVAVWPSVSPVRGRLVLLHGVQSHGGWYHSLGRTLAASGYDTHFPDRRGSGANQTDRGDTPSAKRLIDDVAEYLRSLRAADPSTPLALAGISWGGKTALITAAKHPDLVDALALICPGLTPRVGVPLGEKLRIARSYFTNRKAKFPIPLSDPALFTDNTEAQRFIAGDPLSLREATTGLLAASFLIDCHVQRVPPKVRQPLLLMLAGHDRIVDNAKTLAYFDRLASVNKQVIDYPDGHHTLEFDADPTRYALDLAAWLDGHAAVNPKSVSGVSNP